MRGVEAVDRAFARGASAWPELVADRAAFERIGQAARLRLEAARPAGADIDWDAVNAADVYLVAAIAGGQAAAVQRFEAALLAPCRPALARLGLADAVVTDVLADVRARALVADDGGDPPIARQTGDGNLAALLRVIAVRAALNRREREHRYVEEAPATLDRLVASHSPASQLLTGEAKALLRRVIEAAVATLSERDQALLRLHVYHRMTIDDLGHTYGVHRATAARWLAKIHDAIDLETRRALAAELRTESDHLRSVLDAARTGLADAFAHALGPDAPSPA